MEQKTSPISSLAKLLDASSRPIYAVDARRQIVYANRALADWLGIEPARIVSRHVEYHSETVDDDTTRDAAGPLAGLCPPPKALAGEACRGTVACLTRGRLIHRHAEFVPLPLSDGQPAVLALLTEADMTPDQLAAELSPEPAADELHRTIRRFRRGQAAEYSIESLLGTSSAMRRVRTQIATAAAGRSNVLIRGPRGSGLSHVARAVHYAPPADDNRRLIPVECEFVTEESLRRSLESLRHGEGPRRATVLLANIESLSLELVPMLLSAIAETTANVRFVATLASSHPLPPGEACGELSRAGRGEGALLSPVDRRLLDAISTITIDVPPLTERLEDLPLLAQFFLEACNRGGKQVGSIRPDALDLLALHRWPGELDELRTVIAAAHDASSTHEITPASLPAIIQHAASAAALPRRTVERIVLDNLLASIEREAIVRAMAQAGGNKSAAAELLGMTRARLYRRLVQLELIAESAEGDTQ